jgi:hypothetical protein
MSTLKKILLLSLALVLSFSLVAFAGCESLPQEEIDSIIDGALNADYDTVSFEMTMPMTVEVKGGDSPGTMTSDMGGNGVFDVVNQTMWLDMSIDIEIPDIGSQGITAEAYVLDGWMYVGVEVPDVGKQWMKMAMTEEIWQQQLEVENYVELMATAVEVKYKGTDTVNGVECYVFEVEPNMGVLSDLMITQTSGMGMGMVDLSGFDIGELYKELSVKEWVAKDSYLLQRAEIDMVMEMGPVEAGYSGGEFDKMTMDIGVVMRFFDYDQPVTIILPPEALDAEDVASLYDGL